MLYTALRAADRAIVPPASLFTLPPLPKAVPAPKRTHIMTRRYETSWLDAEGHVQTRTQVAPALPQFEEAYCGLARGSMVETTIGPVAVEDLEPGMIAITAEGRKARILWKGAMTLFPANSVPGLSAKQMVRVSADAFGDGQPMPDLLLGQDARILLKGGRCRTVGRDTAYANALSLTDGEALIAVNPVAPMPMYHLVLERHGTLRCNGIGVESFHPGTDSTLRTDPQLSGLFLAMFPMFGSFADFGPMAHHRLSLDETDIVAAA